MFESLDYVILHMVWLWASPMSLH